MRIAAGHIHPLKRFVALAVVYVLALQALFAGGSQLRLALAETPGICTLLGFEQPEKQRHRTDVCAQHCVAHASLDAVALFAIAATIIAMAVWQQGHAWPACAPVRLVAGFRGRGPPGS
jgi:hypothetical protein